MPNLSNPEYSEAFKEFLEGNPELKAKVKELEATLYLRDKLLMQIAFNAGAENMACSIRDAFKEMADDRERDK